MKIFSVPTRIILLAAATTALAQPAPQTQLSHTTESLRGVSAVSRSIAWASGTHGTYLRTTNAGRTWIPAQVPDAATLDFRAVVAFSADEAFLMSAGPGDQSRIYHTADAGQHWQLQFTNHNPKGFFDSMVFWDPTHGIVLGDPIPEETSPDENGPEEAGKYTGKLKFELLITTNGQTWTPIPPSQLPPAIEGEGAFAASNTCLAILPTRIAPTGTATTNSQSSVTKNPQSSATTNPQSLVTTNPKSSVTTNPKSLVTTNPKSSVIPSEARDLGFAGATTAAVSAQPPKQPWKSGASAPRPPSEKQGASAPDPNIWFATGGSVARVFHSSDRGQTWQVFDTPIVHGPDSAGIFSIAFHDPTHGVIAGGDYKHPYQDGPNLAFTTDAGQTWTLSQIFPQAYFSAVAYDRKNDNGRKTSAGNKNETQPRLFIAGPKFIYDFRPPQNPIRISPNKKSDVQFNALSPCPEGGALAVGPKGAIATIP